MRNSFPRLYLVISKEACKSRDLLDVAEQAVKGGTDMVQLREKAVDTVSFKALAQRLKDVLDRYSVPLIINDNLEVAMHCQAAGIHVGNSDLPPSVIRHHWPAVSCIGYSIEYERQLATQEEYQSDYLGVSPVFSTSTKTNTVTEWGLEGISRIRSLSTKPLVAIGNMNEGNVFDVIKAGADSIAVVSAICGASDPAKAAEAIRNQIEKAL